VLAKVEEKFAYVVYFFKEREQNLPVRCEILRNKICLHPDRIFPEAEADVSIDGLNDSALCLPLLPGWAQTGVCARISTCSGSLLIAMSRTLQLRCLIVISNN